MTYLLTSRLNAMEMLMGQCIPTAPTSWFQIRLLQRDLS